MADTHRRRNLVEAAIGAVLLALAFYGIAASDVSGAGSQAYWTALVLAFALVAAGAGWLHGELLARGQPGSRGVAPLVLHWLGVLVAIQLVYVFIASGRLANADTGLTNGLVLALGTFLAGVYGNWRLLIVGAALGLATACVAYIEEYLWVLLGLAVLAVVVLIMGSEVVRRTRRPR